MYATVYTNRTTCTAPLYGSEANVRRMEKKITPMGARIRALMKKKGFSYRTLGLRVHRQPMTVYGWVVYGSQIKEPDLQRLAKALDTTSEWLRYGDSEPAPEINGDLLADILTAVEEYAASEGITLSPPKRAEAISTLYGLFAAAGNVDRGVVRSIVRLAAVA